MISRRLLLRLPLLVLAAAAPLPAQEPSPEQIQQLVKQSYIRTDMSLRGKLRNAASGVEAPFTLSMAGNTIRFRFDNPPQVIHLDLNDKGFILREVVRGRNAPVPAARYDETIRGTDITYEDLSLRFLYWPNPKRLPDEVISHRNCWKLQIANPGGAGRYGTAIIWVDQKSGAIVQMEAYDRGGHLMKRFKITSGMKVGDGWMLKQMRVESFAPGQPRKPVGRTYLELEK